jgi:AraC-like DNA-binding protein
LISIADMSSVAAELAMSERCSLQRRLTDEGVSFQTLVQTRHQIALDHLADNSLTLIDIAYLLGYEDQNSFFSAFRQWESQPRSDWRDTHTAIGHTDK